MMRVVTFVAVAMLGAALGGRPASAQSCEGKIVAAAVDTLVRLHPEFSPVLSIKPENDRLVREVAAQLRIPVRASSEVFSCKDVPNVRRKCWLNLPFVISVGSCSIEGDKAAVAVADRFHHTEDMSPGTAYTVFLRRVREEWKVTSLRVDFIVD